MRYFLLSIIVFFALFAYVSPVSAATQRCYSLPDNANGFDTRCFQDGKTCNDPRPPDLDPKFSTAPCVDEQIDSKSCTTRYGASNSMCIISNATFVINISIEGLPKDGSDKYYYCLKSRDIDCDNDDLKPAGGKLTSGEDEEMTLTLAVCGKGKSELKEGCKKGGTDFFWPGSTYRVTVYDKKNASSGNIIAYSSFYVTHIYPEVIQPAPEKASYLSIANVDEKTIIPMQLKYTKGPRGKYKNSEALGLGPYWVRAVGDNYISPAICTLDGLGLFGPPLPLPLNASVSLGRGVNKQTFRLTPGNYKIIIKQAKILNRDAYEKDINIINAFAADPNATPQIFLQNQEKWCGEGNFTYFHIPFVVGGGTAPGEIGTPIADPLGWEQTNQNITYTTPIPICPKEDQDENGYCKSITTGLGIKIRTTPNLFIADIFTIVLSIGGIATIIFFIQAGYTLMTSAGNKEKIGQAREQITAAILGLIFLILSITILEFIGVNILRIPGFGN